MLNCNRYVNDIKEVRNMRYAEGKIDKQLKIKILTTWKDVQKLREQQGYQCTTFKLNVIKKTNENIGEEKIKWNSELKQEIDEIVNELKTDYKKHLNEYKKKHEMWLNDKRERVCINNLFSVIFRTNNLFLFYL